MPGAGRPIWSTTTAVPSARGLDVDDLAAGEPRVATRGLEGASAGHPVPSPGSTIASLPTPESTDEIAPDGRVDVVHPVRIEQFEPPARRRRAGPQPRPSGPARTSSRATVASRRAGSRCRGSRRRCPPTAAGPAGPGPARARGPPAHPDQPEIADRGPAGPGVGLEMGDLPAPLAGFEGVHGAEDAAAHDHHPFRAHLHDRSDRAAGATEPDGRVGGRAGEPVPGGRPGNWPSPGPLPGSAKLTLRPFGGGATGSAHDSGS